MKRVLLAVVVVVGVGVTGCGVSKARVDALEARVATLELEHGKTRDKLQQLLIWVNHRDKPNEGLYDWVGEVQAKLWPTNGPGDPVKPASPPPPF